MYDTWSIRDLLDMGLEDFTELNLKGWRLHNKGALRPSRLEELLRLEDIDRIVESQALVSSMVRVHNGGRRLSKVEFTTASSLAADAIHYVDSLKLFRCFRDGGTVTFRAVHRYWPAITKLSWDLSRELGCAVTANAYLTPIEAQGLYPHYDFHDLLVIQLAGSKDWYSYDKNADLPLDRNNWRSVARSVSTPRPPTDEPISGVVRLERGDVLFVPRGSNHAARSEGEVSLHLTLELQEWTFFDVVSAILKEVPRSRRLREPLPLGERGQLRLDTVQRAVDIFSELASEIDIEHLSTNLYRETHVDLFETPVPLTEQYYKLHHFADSDLYRLRPDLLIKVRPLTSGVEVSLRDRVLKFPLQHAEAVHRALSGEVVSVNDCVGPSTSIGDAQKILRALIEQAVLIPVPKA